MDRTLRILILEDRPSDADLMEFELQEAGFTFVSKRVMSQDSFTRELVEFSPDLILSDYDLPQYTGFLALTESREKCPDVPFILVTGAIGEDRAIEILTHGAKDYVMKSRLHRLIPAVQRALAEAEEHKARKEAEENLRQAHRTLEAEVKKRTAELRAEITERKRTENALRESEERYRELVQSSPDAVIVQRAGRFLFANPAALRLYGADSVEQLQRKRFLEMIHPDERSTVSAHVANTEGQGMPLRETKLMRLDGQVVSVEAIGTVVYDQGKRAMQIIIRDITERKRAEEALAAEKMFSDSVIDSLPGVFFILDEDGALVNWNKNAQMVSGYSADELTSMNLLTVVAEEDRELVILKLREGFAAGAATAEVHLLTKGGIRVPYYLTGTRVAIGGKRYLIGTGIDSTERRQKEERIAKLTRLYAALSRVNETIIRVRDAESLYREVCRIVSEECSFPLVWIGLKQGRRVVPAAWFGPAADYLKEIKVEIEGRLGKGPTGTSIREKRAVINDDFTTNPSTSPWRVSATDYGFRASAAFPLRLRGAAIGAITLYAPAPAAFDRDQVALLESLSADISYAVDAIDQEQLRGRAEEALRESEERLHEIIEFAPDATFAIDRGRKIIAWNRAIEEMTGFKAADMLGKGDFEYSIPFYGERRPVLIDLAFGSDEARVRYHFVENDEGILIAETNATLKGSRRVIWAKAGLLHDNKGNITGAIESIRDITDRKQVEEQLSKRTLQLEELNRELESFSYSVSHDLRAPLRAIDGYARMILKKQGKKLDEDTLSKFNVIRSGTERMGQLIDDLLIFSRLGRQHMSVVKLDMGALIRDAWKEISVINPERRMRLTVGNIPAGHGDRSLINQVLLNLLSNAVKFTKYRADARIEAGGHTDGNENVYFIRDNGAGFDMAYYDKLFGVFHRLHSDEAFEGTGVGLAIVQRIIHRHGGRVWAEGKVDEGACFYFSLGTRRKEG
ncbi:MAG TPA: PAS domain S-box protein [Syntrophales bacterium]|nr:PAS domain S-box protein [Syntrophales bacterium]